MSGLLEMTGFRPSARAQDASAYSVPRGEWEIDLRLDANEGAPPSPSVMEAIRTASPDDVRRYPDASALEHEIAAMLGLDPPRVVVTNGADEAIDRVCKASLEPGRTLITHDPSFSMISASARLAGGTEKTLRWVDGAFPTSDVCAAIGADTGLVALVTPNNPTGRVIPIEDVRAICARAAEFGALVMVDLAYVEFADRDPTYELLELPNAVVVRTLSKAYGLAGLRVGYAVGSEGLADALRAVGGPYPVSAVSVRAGIAAVRDRAQRVRYIERVATERAALTALAEECGIEALPSEANSVALRSPRAGLIRDGLASLGIAVRGWSEGETLRDLVRVTLPGDEAGFERLAGALRSVAAPEALLLDMDGVLADVSGSYRAAIIETAASFGAAVTDADIEAAKRAGDANNDWVLTRSLLEKRGVTASLDEVQGRFQAIYLGSGGRSGLRGRETLIPAAETLRRLASRLPLGVVTGRPRDEASWFLDRSGLTGCFSCVVAMEDAPAKPDAAPTRLAMSRMGVSSAWLVGDTVDDVRSARDAGVMPVAVCAPGAASAPPGAARTIDALEQLLEILP